MAATNPAQDWMLYDDVWTKKIDILFIDIVAFQQQIGNFTVGGKNGSVISVAIDSIFRQTGVQLTFKQCQERVSTLFNRYKTFAWVLRFDQVMHDPVTNEMHAPEHIWQLILKTDRLAAAYRLLGDPSWEELQTIFGPREPVGRASIHDVVLLSSEESDEEEEANADPKKEKNVQPRQLRLEPRNLHNQPRDAQPRSACSRNVQRSIWDYVAVSSSDASGASRETTKSTANNKGLRPKAYIQILRQPPSVIYSPGPAHSGNGSSCASNDPFRN